MMNTTTQNSCDQGTTETLADSITIEQSEELSSHMLFTPETCRVWWQGYYLPEENPK